MARLKARPGGLFMFYKALDANKSKDWSQNQYGLFQKLWNVGWYSNHISKPDLDKPVSADENLDLNGRFVNDDVLRRLQLMIRDQHAVSWCTDFAQVKAQPLFDFGWGEPRYEMLFTHACGYWMIEEGYKHDILPSQ